ncbi:MAG: hypothetical protein ACK5DV_15030, partial [Planctomycetota bacterium]
MRLPWASVSVVLGMAAAGALIALVSGKPALEARISGLESLKTADIVGIVVRAPGRASTEDVELERTVAAGKPGPWTMSGGWPVRQEEANSLAESVGALRTRFVPQSLQVEGVPFNLT